MPGYDRHKFELIDWDDEEDESGNLAHCLRHGVDESVVAQVLWEQPVEIQMDLRAADYAIVGPDAARGRLWTLLFDHSWKRGDWLRPVTGWVSKPDQIRAWESATGQRWRGRQ